MIHAWYTLLCIYLPRTSNVRLIRLRLDTAPNGQSGAHSTNVELFGGYLS